MMNASPRLQGFRGTQ